MRNFKEAHITLTVDILMAKSDRELAYRDLLLSYFEEWLKNRSIPYENLKAVCETEPQLKGEWYE